MRTFSCLNFTGLLTVNRYAIVKHPVTLRIHRMMLLADRAKRRSDSIELFHLVFNAQKRVTLESVYRSYSLKDILEDKIMSQFDQGYAEFHPSNARPVGSTDHVNADHENDTEMCVTCGRHKAKYKCDGCEDDFGMYCGHCARPVIVAFIGRAMRQRLCPICRMSGDDPMDNGIFDARHFSVELVEKFIAAADAESGVQRSR